MSCNAVQRFTLSVTFIFTEKPSEFKALRGKIPIIYYSSPEYHGRIKRYLFDNANADGFAIAISNYKGVIEFFLIFRYKNTTLGYKLRKEERDNRVQKRKDASKDRSHVGKTNGLSNYSQYKEREHHQQHVQGNYQPKSFQLPSARPSSQLSAPVPLFVVSLFRI